MALDQLSLPFMKSDNWSMERKEKETELTNLKYCRYTGMEGQWLLQAQFLTIGKITIER